MPGSPSTTCARSSRSCRAPTRCSCATECKFHVGQIVYVAFSRDETLMGFAFPKEERDALIAVGAGEVPVARDGSDLRFNWVGRPPGREDRPRSRCASSWSMRGAWVVPKSSPPPTTSASSPARSSCRTRQIGPRAVGWWRAGPVAGHGLRLRKLRLTPRLAPPARTTSLPGRAPSSASRSAGVTPFAAAAPAPGPCVMPSAASVVAAVVGLRLGEPTGAPRSVRTPVSTLRVTSGASAFTRRAGASDQLSRSCRFATEAGPSLWRLDTLAARPEQERAA